MAVTIKVNGCANSLVHKGSNGISVATLPDVCKTPSPGGPVPIPYPNVSQSSTLSNGTTTVKADGGMMIAIKGSEFSISNGDNPGVAGGVKSNTFMKESTWISYSFDVKMEGGNACRLSDKKFQNHQNTVDASGVIQVPVMPTALPYDFLRAVACLCDKAPENNYDAGVDRSCRSAGVAKHECCEDALRRHELEPHRTPRVTGERGYHKDTGVEIGPPGRIQRFKEGTLPKGSCWPDAAAVGADGQPEQFFDFKFKCKSARYEGVPTWTSSSSNRRQLEKYEALCDGRGIDAESDPPTIIHNVNCPPIARLMDQARFI